ncbi:MAG: DUF3307 domain-containing protein [Chloroflexota bacterium]|nr:DUF3307 domain-containing protein [Chloroflexota bacterium]
MLGAMFLAHILADYVFQWDGLARWKSERLSGVLVHGGIVLITTWLLSLPYSDEWWPYALIIGLTHTLIDFLRTSFRRVSSRTALVLFLFDQFLHLTIILAMLALSGHLVLGQIEEMIVRWAQDTRLVTFLVGYVFITTPAWIVVSFLVRGLVASAETEISPSTNKYIGILERGLITTLVIAGQFALIPLVAAPRLISDGPRMRKGDVSGSYVAELLASAALAIAVGLALRQV